MGEGGVPIFGTSGLRYNYGCRIISSTLVLPLPRSHHANTPVPQARIELYDRRQTKFINAHNNALCCMALSLEGKRLATASDKGTLVRVWNTADGQLLQVRVRGLCRLCHPSSKWAVLLDGEGCE